MLAGAWRSRVRRAAAPLRHREKRCRAARARALGTTTPPTHTSPRASLVGLPPEARAADLLEARGAHGKKSGLKAGAAPRVGRRRRVTGVHADGSPIELEIQARLGKEGPAGGLMRSRARAQERDAHGPDALNPRRIAPTAPNAARRPPS